jgi:hypothetical protein
VLCFFRTTQSSRAPSFSSGKRPIMRGGEACGLASEQGACDHACVPCYVAGGQRDPDRSIHPSLRLRVQLGKLLPWLAADRVAYSTSVWVVVLLLPARYVVVGQRMPTSLQVFAPSIIIACARAASASNNLNRYSQICLARYAVGPHRVRTRWTRVSPRPRPGPVNWARRPRPQPSRLREQVQ